MGEKKTVNRHKLKELMNLDIKDIKINFNKKDKRKKNNKNIISFDIDEEFIHIVEGKYHKNTLTLIKMIDVLTPTNSINDGNIINEEIIIDVIQDALEANKIKSKYASFTTNSTLLINREMIIPVVKEDEIETVINFEISQYLPINLQDYIIQSIVLEEIEINGIDKLKVNTTCYPKK